MKQINLVPPSVRQRAANQQLAPLLVLAGIFGLVAAGAIWAGLTAQRSTLESQQTKLVQQEEERAQQLAKELEDLQLGPDITARVDQLNSLAPQDINWDKAFTYVARILPKDIVLNGYTLASAPTGVTLKISGEAPSNVSYATFAEHMKGQTGALITSFKVDGYMYDPKTGRVTFAVTITVPAAEVRYTTAP
jgi:Tfp pilus assembly protein PilN